MENKDHWDLYIFPGGKVGTVKSRLAAKLWMMWNAFRLCEKRAINTVTKEHMVS